MTKHGLTITEIAMTGLISFLIGSTALADSEVPAAGGGPLRDAQPPLAQDVTAPGEMTGDSPDTLDAQHDDQMLLSNLMGAPVVAMSGETIGEVEDLLLTDDGRLEAIVISLGGIQGVGGKPIAVPWTKVAAFDTDNGIEILAINVGREALEAAPAFQKSEEQGAARVLVGMEELFNIAPAAGALSPTEELAE